MSVRLGRAQHAPLTGGCLSSFGIGRMLLLCEALRKTKALMSFSTPTNAKILIDTLYNRFTPTPVVYYVPEMESNESIREFLKGENT
jgi:hypothetical protein